MNRKNTNARFQFRAEFTRRDREKSLRRCEAIILIVKSEKLVRRILVFGCPNGNRRHHQSAADCSTASPSRRSLRSAANSNRQLVNSFIAHRRQTHSYCMQRHINSWRTHLQASGQVAEPKAKSFNNFRNFGYYYKLFHIFRFANRSFSTNFRLSLSLWLIRPAPRRLPIAGDK